MKQVNVTIHYAKNSKSVSAIFNTDNADDLKRFFEILSDGSISDRAFSVTENVIATEESEKMKILSGLNKK